jgi:hypothetical protein
VARGLSLYQIPSAAQASGLEPRSSRAGVYLKTSRDSPPNYGKVYRADQPISTGWVESTVNEIIAKRIFKKQKMRWNWFTVRPFHTVRVHVLNATLGQVFNTRHTGFQSLVAA